MDSTLGRHIPEYPRKSLVLTPFCLKGMERAIMEASTPASSGFGRTVNEIWTLLTFAREPRTNQSLLFTNGRKNLKMV